MLFCKIASSGDGFDGYLWEKWNYNQKQIYVYGYLDGVKRGEDASRAVAFGKDLKGYPINDSTAKGGVRWLSKKEFMKLVSPCNYLSQYANSWANDILRKFGLRQMVDGIDAFYSDDRNKGIWLEYAVDVVGNYLTGYIQKDNLQKGVDYMRKTPIKPFFSVPSGLFED